MVNGSILLLAGIAILTIVSCIHSTDPVLDDPNGDDTTRTEMKSFVLAGNYLNTTGSNPEFQVAETSSDSAVHFDGSPNVNYNDIQRKVTIRLNNVSISTEDRNYAIDSVAVEERVDGTWTRFSEFETEMETVSRVAVILVLDVSSSLGNDFAKVQEYATEFVNIIAENQQNAQIGIVNFATEVDFQNITANYESLREYISQLEQGEYTALYDAMDRGINLLGESDFNAKVLVTFTDGRDNYSSTTPDSLRQLLTSSNVKSFTMGLEGKGGVEGHILEDLAVNGRYQLTRSIGDVQEAFQAFGEEISKAYRISYIRNDQVIAEPRLIRFLLMDFTPGE